jgi:hypothetical protein
MYGLIISVSIFFILNFHKIKNNLVSIFETVEIVLSLFLTVIYIIYSMAKKKNKTTQIKIYGWMFVVSIFIFYSLLLCMCIQKKKIKIVKFSLMVIYQLILIATMELVMISISKIHV